MKNNKNIVQSLLFKQYCDAIREVTGCLVELNAALRRNTGSDNAVADITPRMRRLVTGKAWTSPKTVLAA